MEENEHVSHASFCDLQVVIPSASGFGEEDISALIQVIYFMKRERKERFLGLQYSTKIPCPECNKLTLAWDPTDENEMKKSQHFCGECYSNVDLSALFSQAAAAEKKPEQRLEEERSNDETSLAYQLMRPVPPNECLVMISFNDASAGPDAVELANFLTKLGYPTFCTGVFCGTQVGDWREYTEAGAMHCQFYIPQMTKLWQESNANHQKSTCKEGSYSYPCFFTTDSFDDEYDNQPGHYYRTTWNSIQSVYKDRVQDWKKIVVKLFPPLLQHDNSSTKRVVLPQ